MTMDGTLGDHRGAPSVHVKNGAIVAVGKDRQGRAGRRSTAPE